MKSNQKVCNKELLQDTVLATKESAATVKDAVGFVSEFIGLTMKDGAYETVMLPYFGKFQPKVKEIQWRAHRKGMTNTKTHDEPVHDNGDLRDRTQQGVDNADPGVLSDTES